MLDEPSVGELAPETLGELGRADLSPWFNPFLRQFVRDAQRSGGEVRVVRDAGGVRGLWVSDPVERLATAFSRDRSVAENWVRGRGVYGVYSDFSFEPGVEVFDIFSRSLDSPGSSERFRHPVRVVTPRDIPAVTDLAREVYGLVNERWFSGLPTLREVGLVVELEGRLAGMGWISLASEHARLHSLTVRPSFRRMGIGSDLLAARLFWARRMGARDVVSEIARTNVASQLIAERGGMHRAGEIYLHRPQQTDGPAARFG